jgi:hypothetical protein
VTQNRQVFSLYGLTKISYIVTQNRQVFSLYRLTKISYIVTWFKVQFI